MTRGKQRRWKRVLGLVCVAAPLLAGAAGCEMPEEPIELVLEAQGPGRQRPALTVLMGEGLVRMYGTMDRQWSDEPLTTPIRVSRRALLAVGAKRTEAGDTDSVTFAYILRGDEPSPPPFRATDYGAALGDEPVLLDLNRPGALGWLWRQPIGGVGTIRTVALRGEPRIDTEVLRRLAATGVLVTFPEGCSLKGQPALVEALVAARPRGIVAGCCDHVDTGPCEGLADVLPRLEDLTHLTADHSALPALRHLKRLEYLALALGGESPASLEALGELPRLRHLLLNGWTKAWGFPTARLKALRSLQVSAKDGAVTDLSAFEGLGGLRMLLASPGPLKDLSALTSMPRLRELALPALDPGADLGPIAQLRHLEVLLVLNDTLKKRKAEFEALEKAIPGLRVVGFCMGSAWVLAVVPGGMLAGLAARRLRRKRRRA